MNTISDENIQNVNLSEVEDSEIVKIIKNSKLKVLRFQNCMTLKNTVELIRNIHAELNLLPFLLVIIIEVFKNGVQENHVMEISKINPYFRRELIIQILQGGKLSTFVRENGETSSFIRIKFDQADSVLLKETLNCLSFRSLFKLLRNGIGGSCNGSLLSSLVDIQQKFFGRKLLDYAVVQGQILSTRFLSLFDWDLEAENDEGIKPLEYAAKQNQIEVMKILLDIPLLYSESSWLRYCSERALSLLRAGNSEGNNILMIAAEAGNLSMVKFLLKLYLPLDTQNKTGERASDLAYKNCHFDVLYELLTYDSPFPKDFKSNSHHKIEEIITKREDFHEFIEYGEIDEVMKFIAENPLLKFGYSSKNMSAVSKALQYDRTELYFFLRSKGFSNGIDGKFDDFLKKKLKTGIADANLNHFKPIISKAITELLSRSRFGFNVENSAKSFTFIKWLFETLLKIEKLQSMIIFVSGFKELQIIFDVNHNSIHDLDPCADRGVFGRTYTESDLILIGSRFEDQNETLATLAHEICHYALLKLYRNSCKPYRNGDETKKQFDFIKMSISGQPNLSIESTISSVFQYPDDKQTCELIVRVPEMYAKYRNDSENLIKAQLIFKELFKFFDDVVKPDFDHECSIMIKKYEVKLNDFKNFVPKGVNILFKEPLTLDHKKVFITVTEIFAGVLKVYEHLVNADLNFSKIFVNFQKTACDEYVQRIKSLLPRGSKESMIVIVDESDDGMTDIQEMNDNMKQLLNKIVKNDKSRIIAISRQERFKNKFEFQFDSTVNLKFAWNDLSEEFVQNLLKIRFLFQNCLMTLSELLNIDTVENSDFMASELFSLDKLKVNFCEEVELSFFIDRRFKVKADDKSFNIAEEKVLENSSQIRLIADKAGMGKTSILEYFRLKLIKNQPKHWINMVYLRDKVKSFSVQAKNQIKANFIEFFVSNLLEHAQTAEKVIFKTMFLQGRVILLLDGFDEISPVCNEVVLEFIKHFMSVGGNQLIITSRKHVVKDLRDLNLPMMLVNLEQFSYEDQINFLEKYWKSKQKAQTEVDFKEFARKVHESFIKTSFSKDLQDFIGIPLQTRMLAEIFEDVVVDQTMNLNLFKNKKSLFTFYKMFVTKLLDTWMGKGDMYKLDDKRLKMKSIDIMKVHKSASVLVNFGKGACECLELPLIESFPLEMIARFGILQSEDLKSFKFIHNTFADFFLAQFICESIFCKNIDELKQKLLMKMLFTLASTLQHEITMVFINDLLQDYNDSIQNIDTQIGKELENLMKAKYDFSLLHKPIMRNQYNVVKLFLSLLTSDGLIKVLQDRDLDNLTAFQNLFKFTSDPDKLKDYIKLLRSVFKTDFNSLLLGHEDSNSFNFLKISMTNTEINSFLIAAEIFKTHFDASKLKNLIMTQDYEGNTLLHTLAQHSRNLNLWKSTFESIGEQISQQDLKELIKCKNNKKRNFFFVTCENLEIESINEHLKVFDLLFDLSEISEIVLSVDDLNIHTLEIITSRFTRSKLLVPLLHKLRSIDESKFEKLLFQEKINGWNSFDLFMNKVEKSAELIAFCEFYSNNFCKYKLKRLLLKKQHFLFHSYDSDLCEIFFCIINSEFSNKEVKDYVTQTLITNDNFLHCIGRENSNSEFMSTFLRESRSIIDNHEEFTKFLLHISQDNNTPLHAIVAWNQNHEVFTSFWSTIEKCFEIQEQREIVCCKGYLERNVFFRSLENNNKEMSNCVFEVVKTLFDPSEIKKLFFDKDFLQCDMIVLAVKNQNLIWLKVLNYLKDEITTEDLIDRFNERYRDETLIKLIFEYSEQIQLQEIFAFLERTFEKSILKRIVLNSEKTSPQIKSAECLNVLLQFLKKNLSHEDFLSFKPAVTLKTESDLLTLDNILRENHSIDDLNQYWQKLVDNGQLSDEVFKRDSGGRNLLQNIVLRSVNKNAFETLWNKLKNILPTEKQQKLLNDKCHDGYDCLAFSAMNNNFNIMETLIKVEKSLESISENYFFKEKLWARYPKNSTILHVLARKPKQIPVVKTLFDVLKSYLDRTQYEKFLCIVDDDGNTAINAFIASKDRLPLNQFIKLFYDFNIEGLEPMFFTTNNEGKNVITTMSDSKDHQDLNNLVLALSIKYKKEKVEQSLMHQDKFGMTALHYLIKHNDTYLIALFEMFKTLSFLLLIPEGENSLFLYACKSGKTLLFEKLLNFMMNTFEKAEIRNMLKVFETKSINVIEVATPDNKEALRFFFQKIKEYKENIDLD